MLIYERGRKEAPWSASLDIQVYAHHTIWYDTCIGCLEGTIDNILKQSSSGIFHYLLNYLIPDRYSLLAQGQRPSNEHSGTRMRVEHPPRSLSQLLAFRRISQISGKGSQLSLPRGKGSRTSSLLPRSLRTS